MGTIGSPDCLARAMAKVPPRNLRSPIPRAKALTIDFKQTGSGNDSTCDFKREGGSAQQGELPRSRCRSGTASGKFICPRSPFHGTAQGTVRDLPRPRQALEILTPLLGTNRPRQRALDQLCLIPDTQLTFRGGTASRPNRSSFDTLQSACRPGSTSRPCRARHRTTSPWAASVLIPHSTRPG